MSKFRYEKERGVREGGQGGREGGEGGGGRVVDHSQGGTGREQPTF